MTENEIQDRLIQDRLYELTLFLRQKDIRLRSGPPSHYMQSYVKAAKGIYSLANELAQSDASNTWDWVHVISSRTYNQDTLSIDHYHSFMGEINGWLMDYRIAIGELAYFLSRGKIFKWIYRKKINRLEDIVEEARIELDSIRNGYELSFKKGG